MMTFQTTGTEVGREANDNQVNDNSTGRPPHPNQPPHTPDVDASDAAKAKSPKPQPAKSTEH